MILHPIPPIYRYDSKILILGSFPSVKSREVGFFYGHPRNRFWKILSAVLDAPCPISVEEKKAMLINNCIALWDVIASCKITGSSDSAIKNVLPNDIPKILRVSDIGLIITNGKKASELYRKHLMPLTAITDVCLPSTSPANASFTLERLIYEWGNALSKSLSLPNLNRSYR